MKKENEKFMTELFRTYGDRMYYLARRIVREPPDAEDVVQIALESLMKKTEFLRSLATPALEAYINTTVNHAALNFLRAENREKRKPERMAEQIDTFQSAGQPSVEELVLRSEEKERQQKVWQSLESEERMLMKEKFIDRRSNTWLAEKYGTTAANISMRLTRLKRKIAGLMDSAE
ncbi:MAG: sigma-70 family RNA polymerase sigma factor [Lachnospiraceae bacterium]|nr:sigma-70 family RNA polymerase sigma factor [Lachnospiraceae bacterium]